MKYCSEYIWVNSKMCMQKLVTFAEKLFYEKVFIIVCFHVIFNDV